MTTAFTTFIHKNFSDQNKIIFIYIYYMQWEFTALGHLFKHRIYKIKSHFEKYILFNYQVF